MSIPCRFAVVHTCCVKVNHGFPHPLRRLCCGDPDVYRPGLQVLGPATNAFWCNIQLYFKGKNEYQLIVFLLNGTV